MIDHAWQLHCEKHVHVRDPLMDPCRPFLREPFQLPACNYTSNVVINQNLRNQTESIPPATVFLQAAGIDGFDWIWSGLAGFMQIPGIVISCQSLRSNWHDPA